MACVRSTPNPEVGTAARIGDISEVASPGGLAWKDVIMPKPFPKEFRDDVVRVAQQRDPEVTLAQIAKDFGVHVGTLDKWMRQARI